MLYNYLELILTVRIVPHAIRIDSIRPTDVRIAAQLLPEIHEIPGHYSHNRQFRAEHQHASQRKALLSRGLPDGNIPALINHVRTFLGKEELIELVRYTFVVFGLADCGVNA